MFGSHREPRRPRRLPKSRLRTPNGTIPSVRFRTVWRSAPPHNPRTGKTRASSAALARTPASARKAHVTDAEIDRILCLIEIPVEGEKERQELARISARMRLASPERREGDAPSLGGRRNVERRVSIQAETKR